MDVLSLMRLLGRHWRVTAPAVLLTLLALVAAFRVSSPTYKATGSIVLLNPREAPDVDELPQPPGAGQNPFTRYGDVAIVTDILARIMNSDSKRGELVTQGVTEYDVVANAFQHDPVFEVTGHGPTSDAAIQSTGVVLEEADSVLEELQHAQGADPDYFINSAPLAPPSTAAVVYSSTMRAAIAVLVVGGLCTLGLAVLAEVIAKRRAARRTASAPGPIGAYGANEVAEAAGSNGSAVDRSAGSEVGNEGVGVAGSNGSAVDRSAGSEVGNEGVGVAGSNGPAPQDSSLRVGDDAAGANGSAGSNPPAVKRSAPSQTGPNGSAVKRSVAGVGDSAAGSNGPAVEGSGASRAGEGDGVAGPNGSFDSAGIVPDGPRRGGRAAGSKGSSARGRPPAPLGRRPHRRSPPDKSIGSPAEYRDPPPSDR
jgi:hypothetical protein